MRKLLPLVCCALIGATQPNMAEPAVVARDLRISAYSVKDRNASFIDVEGRRSIVRSSRDPRLRAYVSAEATRCDPRGLQQPVPGALAVAPFYAGDERNPAWAASATPFFTFQNQANDLAARHVAGDESAAPCLLDYLRLWARSRGLAGIKRDDLRNRQTWYQVTWAAAAAAVDYSIIRGAASLDAGGIAEVDAWLDQLAWEILSYETPGRDCCNNHLYWRALVAVAAGVAAGDAPLYQWGISRFCLALADMQPDGGLPLELKRGKRALHYQGFALQPLILIAEFAARQGQDLYGLRCNGRRLQDGLDFLAGRAAAIEAGHPMPQGDQAMEWTGTANYLLPFVRRFPDPRLTRYTTAPDRAHGILQPMDLYFW